MFKTEEEFNDAVQNLKINVNRELSDLTSYDAGTLPKRIYIEDVDDFVDKRDFLRGMQNYLQNDAFDGYDVDHEEESESLKIEALTAKQKELSENGSSLANDFLAGDEYIDGQDLYLMTQDMEFNSNLNEFNLSQRMQKARVNKYIDRVVDEYDVEKEQDQSLEEKDEPKVDPKLAAQYLRQQGLER